ncbi:MAG TPA: hypothetical protein VHT73_14460 [Thermodesulfobacteriota bacterium]|nr:hypothetical protein [Thermodesulfobacteriota bacterium]
MKFDWVEDVVNQCRREKVPVFVKQMGKVLGKSLGMQGKGGDFERFPESVMVREFPAGRGLLGL